MDSCIAARSDDMIKANFVAIKATVTGCLLMGFSVAALAQAKPVPEIDFLTWPAARYQHYYESSNYIAEQWRKLGLKVKLNAAGFPNPMLAMWFKDHQFDAVLSVLSGSPIRMEPDFFTNAQFNSRSAAPGDWNVGSFSNAKVDEIGNQQIKIYDVETRRPLIHQIQSVLAEEQPEGLISSVLHTTAMNTNTAALEAFEPSADGIRSIWNLLKLESKTPQKLVRLGWTIDQASWNPLVARTLEDLDRLGMVYDRLIVVGTDGKPRMWAAESLKVVDPLTIEVKLRSGLAFSDGKPLTAEDVRFTFDYMQKNEAVYFKKYLEKIVSVETIGASGVRFKLAEPYAPFILNTLGQVLILPKHVWADVVAREKLNKPQDYRNQPLVGSGPYRLRHWKEGQETYLERNEKHFAQPKSDLAMIVFGSGEVLAASLKKGSIDVSLQPLVPTVLDEFKKEKHLRLFRTQSNGYMSVRYNVARPPFDNKAFRQALSHAIPYEAIIDEVLNGDGGRTASAITPTNAYWHNASIKPIVFNIERARAILKAGGFSWAPDGSLLMPAR